MTISDSTFVGTFTGGVPLAMFLAYLVWAYVGMVLNVLVELFKRKPESASSPKKLSLSYYFSDNKYRLLIAVLIIPVALLLCKQFFSVDITTGVAFGIGFGSDTLAELIKRKASSITEKTE